MILFNIEKHYLVCFCIMHKEQKCKQVVKLSRITHLIQLVVLLLVTASYCCNNGCIINVDPYS